MTPHSCLVSVTLFSVLSDVLMFPQFYQTDYIILTERIDSPSCDDEYETVKVHNFKYNRTFKTFNISAIFHKDFGYNLKLEVKGHRFASNEYRLFPIIFNTEVCRVLENNEFGMKNLYNCGNAPKCPLVKGNYTFCLWAPDYGRFPPHLPEGRYRIDLRFSYRNHETNLVRWYMEVKSTRFLFNY